MMLEKWTPQTFSPFTLLDGEASPLRTLFGDWSLLGDWPSASLASAPFVPAVDVTETAEEVVVQADLPGFRPSDIALQIENGVLTIAGQRVSGDEQRTAAYHVYERGHGRFRRSFALPGGVDPDKASARYEHGVLTVRLPKREEAKARTIAVQAA